MARGNSTGAAFRFPSRKRSTPPAGHRLTAGAGQRTEAEQDTNPVKVG